MSLSVVLEKLGHCFIKSRQHINASKILQRALDIRTTYGCQYDLHSAEIHFNLGITNCETGELNAAIDCYEKSLNIKTKELGEDSIDVAQVSEQFLNSISDIIWTIWSSIDI